MPGEGVEITLQQVNAVLANEDPVVFDALFQQMCDWKKQQVKDSAQTQIDLINQQIIDCQTLINSLQNELDLLILEVKGNFVNQFAELQQLLAELELEQAQAILAATEDIANQIAQKNLAIQNLQTQLAALLASISNPEICCDC